MLTFGAMKKYDETLQLEVKALREGLEPQPLKTLSIADPSLWPNAKKLRRILSGRVFPGDAPEIKAMQRAKNRLKRLYK